MPYPISDIETAAPAHTAYADVTHLRADLGIDAGDAAATAVLSRAIEVASRQIDGYCGQTFYRSDFRAVYEKSAMYLHIERHPLVSVSSLIDADSNAVAHTVYGQTVRVDLGGLVIGPLTMGYTAGYLLPGSSAPNIPGNLSQACIELARGIYTRRSRAADVTSESLEGIADVTIEPTAIPAYIRALLDPYRLVLV